MQTKTITQFLPVHIIRNNDQSILCVTYLLRGTGSAIAWSPSTKSWLYVTAVENGESRSEEMPVEEVRLLFNNITARMKEIAKEREWTNIA